jgi:hypothetical protein
MPSELLSEGKPASMLALHAACCLASLTSFWMLLY